MIQPHDLLALAERLASSGDEPAGRAAVSRAYYCAFHLVRELIENRCGVTMPAGPEIHRKLVFCLRQSQHPLLIEIGDKLSSLREERNRADYNLRDTRFAAGVQIGRALSVARQIASNLKLAEAQSDAFRLAVRQYAQTVLRLSVKGT